MSAYRDAHGRFAPGPRPRWKELLDPCAAHYAAMDWAIHLHLCALDDATLAEVIEAANQPSQTNCGWSTYRVRNVVREEAQRVLYERQQGGPR